MADNTTITPGVGATVAADDIGGVLHQRVKISVGADGAAADLAAGQGLMAASLPVVIASDQSDVDVVIKDGSGNDLEFAKEGDNWNAADHGIILFARDVDSTPDKYRAVQVDANGFLKVSDGGAAITVDGTVAVTGTFWQATQPISAAALPLPSGAATAALQGGGLPAALAANGGLKIEGVAGGVAVPVSGTVAVTGAGATAATVSVTPTCEAAAYHSGDVLFDSVEIASAARANGTGVELVSLVIRDKDDQAAAAMTLYFFNANTSLGTKNAAPDIDDTEIDTLVGMLTIPASAWVDVGASKVAVMPNVGLLMHPGGASTSLWMAGQTAGTPTQTANGITATLQFVRY